MITFIIGVLKGLIFAVALGGFTLSIFRDELTKFIADHINRNNH